MIYGRELSHDLAPFFRSSIKALIIDIFILIAAEDLSTLDSIATPSSVNAQMPYGLCLKVDGNWSQLVTSSFNSSESIMSLCSFE